MGKCMFAVVALYCIAQAVNAQNQAVKCLDDSFACVGQGASCNNGKCTCGLNYEGMAHLACHGRGFKICSLYNDPRGKTFGGEPNMGIDIPLPCQYILTDVSTSSRDPDSALNGQYQCNVQVFAVEKRIKGKFFISGFEVLLTTNRKTATGVLKGNFGFRAVGNASNDKYSYFLDERQDLAGSYMGTVLLTNLRNQLGGDNVFAADNQAQNVLFRVPRCGLEIIFRAADDQLGKDQYYLPGLSLGVNDKEFDITYNDLADTFCLTPNKNQLTVSDVGSQLGLTDYQAFMFRAMKARAGQNFPGIAARSCTSVHDVAIANCVDSRSRSNGMTACDFIMSHPPFAHCYSKQGDSGDLLDLFSNCLKSYCSHDETVCRSVQRSIFASGCDKVASVEFIGFDCDYIKLVA